MREIEVRGWDKKRKEYNYEPGVKRMEDWLSPDINSLIEHCQKEENYILELYTNRKDINNEKLFEGDIVKYDLYQTENYPPQIGIIKWDDYYLRLGISDIGGHFNIELRKDMWIEKIGTINENPELLESK